MTNTRNPAFLVTLAAIAVLAIAVRLVAIYQSLWLDELHTSWVVSGTITEVAGRATIGNQGPVYFWVAWLITRLMPASEFGLRTLSLVSGAGLVVSVGWLARKWTSRTELGCLVALLAAIDPHMVYFSREARPYALVALMATWHVEFFRRRISSRTLGTEAQLKSRMQWIAMTWLLFYTHFTAILLVPAELVYLVVSKYRRRLANPRWLACWLVDLSWVALGCAAAWPQLSMLSARRDNWSRFVKPQGLTAIWTMFPCNQYVFIPIVAAMSLILLSRLPQLRSALAWRRLCYFAPLLASWYLVPIAIAWFLTQFGYAPLLFRRYVWICAPSLLVNAGLWGSLFTRPSLRCAYLVGVLLLVGGSWLRLPVSTWTDHSREDWRSAIAGIRNDQERHDWPVVIRPGLIEDHMLKFSTSDQFTQYCTFPVRGLYSLEHRPGKIIPVSSEWAGEELTDALRHGPGVWLLYRGTAHQAKATVDEWQTRLRSDDLRLTIVTSQCFDGVARLAIKTAPSP